MTKERELYLVGEERKEAGKDKVSAHNENWLLWARAYAEEVCFWKGQVTIDDVREGCDMFDRYPDHHNAYGAVFRRGDGWVKIGYEPSKRPKAHARPIAVWAKKEKNQ